MRCGVLVGLLTLAIALLSAQPATAGGTHPPVFSDLKYDKAVSMAKEQKKVLLVKATASWCGPCKQMDKTTWRDEKVVAWVKEHGIAIQFDVDEEPELAEKLRIRAMPTTIGYLDGAEIAREVGYVDADEMLTFADSISRGEKRKVPGVNEKGEFVEPKEGEKVDVQELMNAARDLANDGKDTAAADAYVWLWKNMLKHDSAMVGVRGSFMAGEMEQLAADSEAARKKFTTLRDDTEQQLKDNPQRGSPRSFPNLRSDWIQLNAMLNDDDRTLAWFDGSKTMIAKHGAWDSLSVHLQDLLIEHERWADLASMFSDPLKELNEQQQMREMSNRFAEGEHADEMRQYHDQSLRETAGMLYASMLAAGRDQDAGKTADRAIKLMDTGAMRVEMVTWALKAKQPRDAQLEWLKQAGEAGEAVDGITRELKQALREKGST